MSKAATLLLCFITTTLFATDQAFVPFYANEEDRLKDIEQSSVFNAYQKDGEYADLQEKLRTLVNDQGLQDGIVAFHLIKASNNDVIFTHNARRYFRPASNMKVLSSTYALNTLGEDFKFETKLYYRTSSSNAEKIIFVIRGDGDPSISNNYNRLGAAQNRFLQEVTDAIVTKANELNFDLNDESKEIEIQLDDTIFPRQFSNLNWSYHDFGRCYGAPVGGLQIDKSCHSVTVSAGAPGSQPSITHHNGIKTSVVIKNNLIAQNQQRNWVNYLINPLGVEILASGSVMANRKTVEKFPVVDPTLYFGEFVLNAVKKKVKSKVTTSKLGKKFFSIQSPIYTFESKELKTLAIPLMKWSDNQFAESFMMRPTPWKNLVSSLIGFKKFLKETVKMKVDTARIEDGSGVSQFNYLRPVDLVQVLIYNYADSARFETFKKTLPIAGVDGTLRKRMKETAAYKKVWAKTGTISRSATLSGYVEDSRGELYIFSAMVNNNSNGAWSARKLQDKLLHEVASY